MSMKMGIHREPMGHPLSAFLDSRLCGNDGGYVLSQKTPK